MPPHHEHRHPEHGRCYEKQPHEIIMERLDKIEEILRRIENKH